jgi:hypothetical protein
MNKLANIAFGIIVLLLVLGGYWYMNPAQAPRFLREMLPGNDVPAPKSPVSNFRPPQFGH